MALHEARRHIPDNTLGINFSETLAKDFDLFVFVYFRLDGGVIDTKFIMEDFSGLSHNFFQFGQGAIVNKYVERCINMFTGYAPNMDMVGINNFFNVFKPVFDLFQINLV